MPVSECGASWFGEGEAGETDDHESLALIQPVQALILTGLGNKPVNDPEGNSGLLLVRLLGKHKLKVQYFAGPPSNDVKDFDQQASVYEHCVILNTHQLM